MKVSDLIHIMQEIQKKHGDLEIEGECANCEHDGLDVFVLTNDSEPVAIIQVSDEVPYIHP